MLQKYVIHNYYDDLDVGEMIYDLETKRGTITVTDMAHSSIYIQLKYPGGYLDEEQTDKLIKKRVEPPDRQLIEEYMYGATGERGHAYNPYTLFFWHDGRHSSDYLEFLPVKE